MNLYSLFELTNEDWQTVRGYDRERYTELPGLEGPIPTKSGKVLYYDKKEGKFYDRDTDMYLDHDEALAFLNEFLEALGFSLTEADTTKSNQRIERILGLMRAKHPQAQNDLEAILLSFENGQKQDRSDINTLYSQNRSEEEDIASLEKALSAIKKRRGIGEAESNKERAERAAMDNVKAMIAQKQADAAKQPKAEPRPAPKDPHADKSMIWKKGYADGKRGSMDPKAGDAYGPRIGEYEAGYTAGSKVNEDYYETDEQRELARLGRIIMDMGAKRDDDVGAAMGAVGNELTKYGTPQGVSSIKKLEQVTGQPESVIMKMMALAQKVQGDVAVGDDVPDEDELEEADFDTNFKKRIGYTVKGGAASDMMKKQAAQAQQQNRELDPGAAEKGLGIGVLDTAKARKKAKEKGVRAPGSLRASPNTRDPKRLPEAESQIVTATIPNNLRDSARKLERLAKENGVEYSRQGRTVTLTGDKTNVRRIFYKMAYDPANHPKMTPVNEASVVPSKDGKSLVPMKKQPEPKSEPVPNSQFGLPRLAKTDKDRDIKIGDTVETLKMGQMQGTVTGFSKKGGIDKVLFKHKSGKTYATVPENLKVINSESIEEEKKPTPTQPDKWAYAKSQAKKKFDVYPSAYANAWAAKKYKELGGGWR
jgi:hypothetical protein